MPFCSIVSVVVVFCCYAQVYITLCTSCNNLQLQSQFNLIMPIVILVTWTSLRVLFALPSCCLTSDRTMSDAPAVQPPEEHAPPPVPASVAAVSVKIPPFWPADLLVWFAQVEAQFTTRNITSQRMQFNHVVAALSNEFATEVCDIILSPPDVDAYSKLKDLLIKWTAASERKRLQLLFTSEELGNRKPTQLLRRMQQLLGDSAGPQPNNCLLRELFFQRLPSHVRMMLASSGDTVSLDTLADMADKMLEVAPPSVSSLTSPATPQPHRRLPPPARKWPSSGQRPVSYANSSPHCSSPPAAPVAHTPVPTPAPMPPPLVYPLASAGTTGALETRPTNEPPLAPGRETGRLSAVGD